MTPTEQDKDLRRAIVDYRIKCDYYLSDRDEKVISQEEYETAISSELDSVVELITADRKRVALEARIDELNKVDMLTKPSLLPNSGSVETNVKAWVKDRLPQLKAQQEEV